MTARSVVPDYISIISRAIEKAKNDPAQLRQLVYDVARVGLGKQVLISYSELGSEGLQKQISDLEIAIKEVEILSRVEADLLPHDGSYTPLIERQQSPLDRIPTIVRDHLDRANDPPPVAGAALPAIYDRDTTSELLPTTTPVWEATVVKSPPPGTAYGFWNFELPIAFLISLAIYAAIFLRFGILPFGLQSTTPSAAPTAVASTSSALETTGVQKLGFPLPSIYGVYAVNDGKLYALEPLAMRVPDPRVAISAMISSPSHVTIPNGKLAFVIYRRDLVSSAPDSVSIRVIARVVRELKFPRSGPPKTFDVKDEWAIRNKAFQFGVAPINNSPEMIMLRPQSPQFLLPSGRYALVLKGQGYDFSVAGQMTDPDQCLERTDALGGMVYSECASVPHRVADQ
jgi:hypothetical protein